MTIKIGWTRAWEVHVVGRTVAGVGSVYTMTQVREVAEEIGYEDDGDWSGYSSANNPASALDYLATWLIQRSLDGVTAHSEKKDVLTTWKFQDRCLKERPCTESFLQRLLEDPRHRVYRGGQDASEAHGLPPWIRFTDGGKNLSSYESRIGRIAETYDAKGTCRACHGKVGVTPGGRISSHVSVITKKRCAGSHRAPAEAERTTFPVMK